METKHLKIIRNASLVLAGLLLGVSIVLQIIAIRGNDSLGSIPVLFTLAAVPFILILAGLRIKIKQRKN